jgi:hypothetical protein
MSTADRVHFTVAIEPPSDPITGAVRDPGGRSVEFAGWLGFAAALEQLLSAGRQRAATPPELSLGHPERP